MQRYADSSPYLEGDFAVRESIMVWFHAPTKLYNLPYYEGEVVGVSTIVWLHASIMADDPPYLKGEVVVGVLK